MSAVSGHSSRLFPGAALRRRGGRSRENGVLPSQDIQELIQKEYIFASEPIRNEQIQPASLDLRLGSRIHRLQASFLPGGAAVQDKLASLSMACLDITAAVVLERGCVYLAPLLEKLNLPDGLSANANPKSTTGRLDVFTRLITDGSAEFERVPEGYDGPLFAEIMPRTFPVIVHPGLSLSQIRFIRGRAQLNDKETRGLNRREKLIFDETRPVGATIREGGVEVSVSLKGGEHGDVVAYRGKTNTPLIDMDRVDSYDIEHYWDRIREPSDGRLILNPGDFYILVSRERVRVPKGYAAEMVPFDPSVGEFRIHYAGFFDPGFGYGDSNITGTRAVLEVRAHETPFVIEHGQVVGRLVYSRMLKVPDKIYGKAIGSSYQHQELALSKQFRRSAGVVDADGSRMRTP